MRKLLMILAFVLIAPYVLAEDGEFTIQPFGGIFWRDSFLEVVKKMNDLGPEFVKLKTPGNSSMKASLDIKGETNKDLLGQKLGEFIEKRSPKFMNPALVKDVEEFIGKYKDIKGDKKYVFKEYKIVASPVIIGNVPFKLIAYFSISPGLAIRKPDEVLTEPRMRYTFPLILKEIVFYADKSSPLFTKENLKKVCYILKDKYEIFEIYGDLNQPYYGFNLQQFKHSDTCYVKDKEGRYLTIRWDFTGDGAHFNIKFGSPVYENELEAIYKEHLTSLEKSKMKGKKDMSSGL